MDLTRTTRIRLRFAKQGDLRLVSHHDLMRCLERMLRRAALPVAQTQGFHPRPRFAFPLPLAVGIEGRREVLDLFLDQPLGPAEVQERLAGVSPAGLAFSESESVASGKASRAVAACYELSVPEPFRAGADRERARLLAASDWFYTRRRPGREVQFDLRRFVLGCELDPDGTLRFQLRYDEAGSARPEEVLEALLLREALASGAILVRTDVALAPDTPNGTASGPVPAEPTRRPATTPPSPQTERPSA